MTDIENKEREKIIIIPYYGTIFENKKRILNEYQIYTIFRTNSKLNKFIKLVKCPIPPHG